MIRYLATLLFSVLLLLLSPRSAASQAHASRPGGVQDWLALAELPALAIAVVFGFLTAHALRGGRLGAGMTLIAWGFLVMAVGHVTMQVEMLFGINLFSALLGARGGQVAWVVALVVTWGLTGTGFFRLYRASARV